MSRALARRSDPSTSHAAARRVEASGQLVRQKDRVLAALRTRPDVTSAELADLMGTDRYMPARRLADLERDGLAEKTGQRICRAHGGAAVTWRATKDQLGDLEIRD